MTAMTLNNIPVFLTLTGIYEPSAIQQLPDGRFIVVEDEKQYPFSLVTINPDGSIGSVPLSPESLETGDAFWKLDDLEGVALDQSGYIYTTTSHSRDGDGDEKKSRDKLVRFKIEGDRVVEPMLVRGLKPALVAIHPVLASAAEIRDVKTGGGLNIEALEISPDQQRLLIGFRSPLIDNRAIIAYVDNPSEIFEAGEPPRISAVLEKLDLDGNGIRGMSYLPALAKTDPQIRDLIIAEEKGITQANVADIAGSDPQDPEVRRLLGVEGEFGAIAHAAGADHDPVVAEKQPAHASH